MSKSKAVVLEKSGLRYTVLGNDGTFRHIYRRGNLGIGEEIEIHTGIVNSHGLRLWAGIAAVFLLVFMACFGWNLYQAPTAVALLSVDINPSLQFTIDAKGNLLKLQSQNDDAKRILSQVNLTGLPMEQAIGQIITQSYNQKFLNSQQHWVVVGYSPMSDKTSAQMPKELNDQQIANWITGAAQKNGFTPQIAVFPLTSQESELAQKKDLTLGEYALWQTAQNAGVVTGDQNLKDTQERVRLLENPQVQAQIKAEKRGIELGLPLTTGTKKPDSDLTNKPTIESNDKSKSNMQPSSPDKNQNKPGIGKEKGQIKDNKEQSGDNNKGNEQHDLPKTNKRTDQSDRGTNQRPGDDSQKSGKQKERDD